MRNTEGPDRVGRYQRWATYETACVMDGLRSGGDYEYWHATAEKMVRETPWLCVYCDGTKGHPQAVDRIADTLANHFQELMPRMHSAMDHALLQAAYWRVNWSQIAYHLAKPCIDDYPVELADMIVSKPASLRERFNLAIRATKFFFTKPHT